MKGKDLAESWSLFANMPVVDPKQSPVLCRWVPYHLMIILQRLLCAVPVDDLNGRVVHTYDKHPGPIEGALAEAFGFTERAQRVMRIGELEEIFHAVERMEEEEISTRLRRRLEKVTDLLTEFGEEYGSVWFEGAISAPTLYFARNRAGHILAILGTKVSRQSDGTNRPGEWSKWR